MQPPPLSLAVAAKVFAVGQVIDTPTIPAIAPLSLLSQVRGIRWGTCYVNGRLVESPETTSWIWHFACVLLTTDFDKNVVEYCHSDSA